MNNEFANLLKLTMKGHALIYLSLQEKTAYNGL